MKDFSNVHGYRLERLEIKNFGGYDGDGSIITTKGGAIVFAGENGAGKTTAIDAFQLILSARPALNSSSGEKSKADRSIGEYYIGKMRHGTNHDSSLASMPTELRQYGDRTSTCAISAVFKNGKGDVFTAMRLLYMPSPSEFRWRHVLIPQDVHLSGVYTSWSSISRFKEAVEAEGGKYYDSFSSYISDFGKIIGLTDADKRDRALRFFIDAISQRGVNSIEDFSRRYILPESDLDEIITRSESQFELLTKITEKLNAAKKRQKTITDVTARMTTFKKYRDEYKKAMQTPEAIAYLSNFISRKSASFMMSKAKKYIEEQLSQAQTSKDELAFVVSEIALIEQDFDKKGGHRLREMEQDIHLKTKEAQMRSERSASLVGKAENAGLQLVPTDQSVWSSIISHGEAKVKDLESQIEEIRSMQAEMSDRLYPLKNEKNEISDQIASLEGQRSSFGKPYLQARSKLAQIIGLKEEDLPFFGELLQIKSARGDWEPAANRVLNSVAHILFVPGDLYQKAKDELRKHHWNIRLVIKEAVNTDHPNISPSSLAACLEVKEDYAFYNFAMTFLADSANFTCVEEDEFASFNGRSVTKSGAVNRGSRAEKDDRFSISDRRNFVIGWSNEQKIAALKEHLDTINKDISKIEMEFSQAKKGEQVIRDKIVATQIFIDAWVPFEEIDTSALHRDINHLEEQLQRLQTKDLKILEQRKTGLLQDKHRLENNIDMFSTNAGKRQGVLEYKQQDLAAKKTEARQMGRPSREVRHAMMHVLQKSAEEHGIQGTTREIIATLASFEDQQKTLSWQSLKTEADATISNLQSSLNRARDRINHLVTSYLRDNPEERKLVSDVCEDDPQSERNMAAWFEEEENLRSEGIPNLQSIYDEKMRDVAHSSVTQLQMAIVEYDKVANLRIRELNDILAAHVYNPVMNSRVQLRKSFVNDSNIKKFKLLLEQALSDIMKENPNYEAVKSIIAMLTQGVTKTEIENQKYLIDLANWYKVDMEELELNEDGTFGQRINFFNGPNSQSGGEQKRLISVLFGLGFCHMFGLNNPDADGQCFSVMMIDEAFSKLDPFGAKAACDMLNGFGIQLILATPLEKINSVSHIVSRLQLVTKHNDVIDVQPISMNEYLTHLETQEDIEYREAEARMAEMGRESLVAAQ